MGPIIAFSSFAFTVLAAPLGWGSELSLSWVLPARAVYAGESVPLALEITVPEAWLGENLLQLYPQPLGLPLQVSAFEALGQGRLVPIEAEATGGGQSVVVDGAICRAAGPVLSAGPEGPMATFTVQRWFSAPRAGTIQLPAPSAHYAFAAEFRDDFVQGRVPVDRKTVDAIGESSVLEVAKLPELGRPFEFAGMVGAYGLSAAGSKTAALVGESISMTVRVEAPSGAPAPVLEARELQVEASDAFVEQGRSVTREGSVLTIEVSFAALATGFHELPAASLTLFHPTLLPPAYRAVRAAGPGVQVRAASPVEAGTVQAGAGLAPPSEDPPPAMSGPQPTPYWTIGVVVLLFAFAVASVIRRRVL